MSLTVQGMEIAMSDLGYGAVPDIPSVPTKLYDLTGVGSLGASLIKSLTDVQTGSLSLKDNICLQGTVTMEAEVLFFNIELPIEVWACIRSQTDEGMIVNVHLKYSKVSLLNNGAASVDLTVKNGRMYIKRVTDGSLFKPSKTETMEVPLEDFQDKDKMGKAVDFMLNSSLISTFMPEISSDEDADIGDFINSFECADNSTEITLNGTALLGDDFSAINVTLNTEGGSLQTIGFDTKVMSISTVSGSLTLCEKENMENVPTDISGEFSEDGETGE